MSKQRIGWLDLIKILACVMVVLLHSVNIGLDKTSYTSGLWIYYLGTYAIPLFFMVNGYLMIGKENTGDLRYLSKKIFKIVSIIVFWNIPIYFLKVCLNKNVKNIFLELFGCLFQKGIFFHFWFLGALILLYCLLPLIDYIYKHKSYDKIVGVIVIINILIDFVFILMNFKYEYIFREHIIQTFRLWQWILYYMLGGYIKHKTEKLENINLKKLIFITIICIAITVIAECIFSKALYGNMYAESFYSNLLVVLGSILIFVLLSRINISNSIITKISNFTMGIYIVHVLVLNVITKLITFNNNYFCLIKMCLVFMLSLLISFLLSKIPVIKEFIKL